MTPAQDALVLGHLDLVQRIATVICRRLPTHVDRQDLLSAGYLGLVEAASRYRSETGVPFGAFSHRRIRGAMVDFLRQEHHVSGVMRRHRGEPRNCFRPPGRQKTTRANHAARAVLPPQPVQLSVLETGAVLEMIPQFHVQPTIDDAPAMTIAPLLRHVTRRAARIMVEAYALHDMTLKEAAALVDRGESRGSQYLAEAVRDIRKAIAA